MTEIRILQVIGSMNRGGAETMLMNYYRTIDRGQVQFDFIECCSGPSAFDAEIEALGGRIFHCPRYTVTNHLAYVRWWKAFFAEHAGEYRVIHGHIGSTAAIYLRLAKKAGLYTIVHSHNTRVQTTPRELLYAAAARPAGAIADQCFACSRAAGISRFGRRIGGDEKRCLLLNNAIDAAHFAYDPQARAVQREVLGLKDALVIGHVGRFNEQKNHRFLLAVFARVLKQAPSARLLLVGGGTLEGELRAQAAALGIEDAVLFAGVQSDVAPFYQAMDVFVFPSLFEGFGIAPLEAQAAGLPCLLSDRIPQECIIMNSTTSLPLSSGAEVWAEAVLARCAAPRTNTRSEIAAAGFDISDNAEKLQQFYEKAWNQNG